MMRDQRLAGWAILVLAVALRLFRLDAQSFWIDEIYQLIDAARPLESFLAGYLELDPSRTHKSPLSLLLHRLVLQLGESEFLLRLPSVLFSVAEVGLLFLLVRALAGFGTAALSAFLLAISPLHVWYAQELRYYSFWTAFVTGSFLALAMVWKRGPLRAWLGYVGSLALAAGSFLVTAFVVPLQWISAAILARSPEAPRRFSRAFLVVHGVLLVLALPILSRVPGILSRFSAPSSDVDWMALPYTFYTFVAGFSAGPSVRELHFSRGVREILLGHPEVLLFAAVFAPVTALGVWHLFDRDRHTGAFVLPWAFGLPMLVFAASLLVSNSYNVRYALPALTGFTVVLAAGFLAVRPPWLRRAAMGAAVLLVGFSLLNYYFDARYHKADVRSAVAHVRSGSSSDAPLMVTGQILVAVGYYGDGNLAPLGVSDCDADGKFVTVAGWRPDRKFFSPRSVPRESFEEAPSLWLMQGRDWQRRGARCLEWLSATHRVVERARFPGVELFRLSRRDRLSSSRPARRTAPAPRSTCTFGGALPPS